jgi:hypothetical protein
MMASTLARKATGIDWKQPNIRPSQANSGICPVICTYVIRRKGVAQADLHHAPNSALKRK